MSLQHRPITFLPPAAVFEALREMGRYARKQVENQHQTGQYTKMLYWQGATPSEEVARLLLHVVLEDNSLLLGSHLGFYLFSHGQILRNMTGPPDTMGWEEAAYNIMAAMENRIQIHCDNGDWDVICSTEIRQIQIIRDLIKKIVPEKPQIVLKNTVVNSVINAGGNVHIGDKHNASPT